MVTQRMKGRGPHGISRLRNAGMSHDGSLSTSVVMATRYVSERVVEGPLSKWTNVMNGWQYRWFVLDQSAGLLSYYTVS